MRKPPTTTPARSTPNSSPSARSERARPQIKASPSSPYLLDLINPIPQTGCHFELLARSRLPSSGLYHTGHAVIYNHGDSFVLRHGAHNPQHSQISSRGYMSSTT